jgi:hypothetical protein
MARFYPQPSLALIVRIGFLLNPYVLASWATQEDPGPLIGEHSRRPVAADGTAGVVTGGRRERHGI